MEQLSIHEPKHLLYVGFHKKKASAVLK